MKLPYLRRSQLIPIVFFAVLAFGIMFPLLSRGYILTLDMVFGPHISLPAAASPTYPLYWILHIISIVVPVDILQKGLLFGIFMMAGCGMFRLFRALAPVGTELLPALFAGSIYAVNPFVYSRFMAGQYLVLLGYAMVPCVLLAWYRFLYKPIRWRGIVAALWAWLLGCVSLHMLGLAVLPGVLLFGLALWQRRHDRVALRRLFAHVAFVFGGWVVLSAFWIIPIIAGTAPAAQTISAFGAADFNAFRSPATGWGLMWAVIAMGGFWADAQDMYMLPQDIYGWWWLPLAMLLAFVGYGMYRSWRMKRGLTIALLLTAVVAAALAVATSLDIWFAAHVSAFAGYRETNKFVALIVLAYAYFGAVAVADINGRLHDSWRSLSVLAIAIPLLTAPLLFGGANGQLTPRHYPADWYAVREQLARDSGQAPVLFLPWHLYMRYEFAGRTIATPARAFFDVPVITSADPEFKQATGYGTDRTQQRIASILERQAAYDDHLGKPLAAIGIRYIVLAKDFDYRSYDYLNSQKDIHLVSDTSSLRVYQVGQ